MRYTRTPTVFILTALIGLFVLTGQPRFAQAGDCMRLCDDEFMQSGTASDIGAEIAKGADIEARDKDGFTPLHRAADEGNAKTITALLAAGADIETRDKWGFTPLHSAAAWNKAETVTVLLKAGANANARTEGGYTPFDLAKDNDKLKNTKAYWLLNEARYK